MSPNFTGSFETLLLEGLIVGPVILLALGSRIAWVEAVLLAFFLQACLTSQRHVTLLVIVAVPILARELVQGLHRVRPHVGRLLARRVEAHPQRLAVFLYYAAFCVVFLALAGRGALTYRSDLDDIELSAAAASYIEEHPQQFACPFNTDNLGGALIYRFWPSVHVFVDDRTPVYGDDFIIDEYIPVARARPGWEAVLDRWEIRSAVVKAETSVAVLLEASPSWKRVLHDDKTALFLRVGAVPVTDPGARAPVPRQAAAQRPGD